MTYKPRSPWVASTWTTEARRRTKLPMRRCRRALRLRLKWNPSAGTPPGAPAATAQPPTGTPQGVTQGAPTQPPGAPQGSPQRLPEEEKAIGQEVDRLKQPPFDATRFENPEAALRTQAIQNLGVSADSPKPSDVPVEEGQKNVAGFMQKIIAVPKDIGYGLTLDTPREAYRGIRDFAQSSLDMAADFGKWLEKVGDLPGIKYDFTGKGAPLSIVSGEELQQLHRPFEGTELPQLTDEPHSYTGTFIKNGLQFALGMASGTREMAALGLPTTAAGWAGRGLAAAKGFLGMFQAFDGAQGRLSDLVQSVPALRNPITEALASKPDDNEAMGRLKNAMEGMGLSQVADGLVGGVRMLRGALNARESAQALVEAPRAPPPVSAGLQSLGNPEAIDKPLTEIVSKDEAKAAQEKVKDLSPEMVTQMGEHAPKDAGVYVNFARIDGPEDLKAAMGELAGAFKDDIQGARRGVQTFEQTKLGANAVDAWQTLLDRRVGQPLGDAETLAVRQLWASSASKTMELAHIATEAPSPENLFAFRKMLATHAAIQEQVIAARTETARALSSWRIPAGSDEQRLTGMAQALADDRGMQGGIETSYDIARRVAALNNAGDIQTMQAFAEKGAYAKSRDAVLEAWTNGLLTALGTHTKVFVSNAATVALRMGERAIAARISSVLGDTDGVQIGKASAQYAGLMGGLRDSMRFIGKSANALLSGEKPELGTDPTSLAIKAGIQGHYSMEEKSPASEYLQNQGAISSEAFGMSSDTWLGQGIDLAGQIIRTPGRALTAEHDYFRSLGYRMELNAQAVRQAVADVHSGAITEDALGSRIQEIIANPPDNVKLAAVNGTTYQTYTDAPGILGEKIGGLRNAIPELRAILPFYKIPSRIMSFTMERTPLAPVMSTFRQNIAAGGARQSLALAQMGLGTMVTMAAADAVLSGQLTGSGPREPGLRAAMENEGWLPYSQKVGDKWVQYNRLETVGSAMAIAADATEAIREFTSGVNGDDPDVMSLAVATAFAVANDVTSKSYLQGLSNFFETMAEPKTASRRLIESFAGSAIPAGVASIDRVTDPYKRVVSDMISAVKARTPGQSETLPPVRNLWGEPVKNASGMGKAYDLLVPAATREAANEPIDKEMLRMGVNVPKPSAKPSFDGIPVNLTHSPQIYSRYQELAGNDYKEPSMGGLGLKDALNSLVSGTSPYSVIYQHLPDGSGAGEERGTKGTMIRDWVNNYRHAAGEQLLSENKGLAMQVEEKRQAMQDRQLQAMQQ